LEFEDDQSEQIWKVIKNILEVQTTLLYDKLLDQLIICSIYAIYKSNQKSFKQKLDFMSILNLYSNLDFFMRDEVRKVKIRGEGVEKDTHTVVDLITFYNKHYLTHM